MTNHCHEAFPAGPAHTNELGATCGRCGGDRNRPTAERERDRAAQRTGRICACEGPHRALCTAK